MFSAKNVSFVGKFCLGHRIIWMCNVFYELLMQDDCFLWMPFHVEEYDQLYSVFMQVCKLRNNPDLPFFILTKYLNPTPLLCTIHHFLVNFYSNKFYSRFYHQTYPLICLLKYTFTRFKKEISRKKIKMKGIIPVFHAIPKKWLSERETDETCYENNMKSIGVAWTKYANLFSREKCNTLEWPLVESRRPCRRSIRPSIFPIIERKESSCAFPTLSWN